MRYRADGRNKTFFGFARVLADVVKEFPGNFGVKVLIVGEFF